MAIEAIIFIVITPITGYILYKLMKPHLEFD